jgi:hypothetical protein
MRPAPLRFLSAAALLLALPCVASCGSNNQQSTTGSTTTTTGGTGGTGGDTTAGTGGTGGDTTGTTTTTTTSSGPPYCETAMLPQRPWSDGPYGKQRGDVADDFTLDLADGSEWRFKDQYSGCESYIFLPDTIPVSQLDKTSIWTKDLPALLKGSPRNVHYFFVSRLGTDDAAKASTDAMTAKIATALGALKQPDADHWKERLHVVAKRAALLDGWVKDVLSTIGVGGFAIDRFQRVRGIGNLADVKRFKQALQDAMAWPWEQNLAYAQYEARYFNAQFERQAKLDAENATVVPFWKGEVLSQFAEIDVDLPSEADMAKFDTLEVEIESACPDATKIEFGNCGAWDYIAALSVQDDQMNNIEFARFITSYHRETHWVVDASPMLFLFKKGGKRHFRWDFAPPWNVQPTATKLSLRFSNQNKGYAAEGATFLFAGGDFTSMYNASHMPIDVPIPADAKHVELVAIVTGHGSGTNQCSEFCDHQHSFKVNGMEHVKDHPEAGTIDKCIAHVDNGMVPNQGGTWWFGRGGWCPGQQVDPWIVDVTKEVTPGMNATIEYQGLYAGAQPPDGSGNIDLVSYLVIYK